VKYVQAELSMIRPKLDSHIQDFVQDLAQDLKKKLKSKGLDIIGPVSGGDRGTCPPHLLGGGGQYTLCPPHVLGEK